MSILATELLAEYPELFTELKGNQKASAQLVTPPLKAQTGTLCFAASRELMIEAIHKKASIVVTSDLLLKSTPQLEFHQCLVGCRSVPLAMSKVLNQFENKKSRFQPGIHPTALIHPTASLAESVWVGPYSIINEGCVIGEDTIIGPHCIIESHSKIGQNTLLHGQIFVGAFSEIGHNCEIHPHTTLGADGFGFVPDFQGHHKIPQIGKVIIENNVEIQANCAIDRGTLDETRIGEGSKLDNFCHVAHNVQIGKYCLITAGLIIAGSSKIGDFFVCGGRTSITDHIEITSNVQLAGASVVMNDIGQSGKYGGYPLQPLKDFLKTTASLIHLPRFRKQILKISRHLNLNDKNLTDNNINDKPKDAH